VELVLFEKLVPALFIFFFVLVLDYNEHSDTRSAVQHCSELICLQ